LAISCECWNSAQSHLDYGPGIPEQNFRGSLDDSSLPRTRRPQKQQVPYWTPRRIEPSQKHLVDFGDLFDSLVLAYDAAAQRSFKLSRIGAAAVRIEHCSQIRSHNFGFLSYLRPYASALPCSSPVSSGFLNLHR
jgi:hypothetical protein